ncbi:glutathione S-transferase [Fistulina hepatica ATCC 64428]|uniref:glutathione transferase n=1 Tax=Fistulina hepatica ATCC 64428 TaxID=1128425 RepID=A0A0D7A1Z8_9AGAR|nr:glutathione S-transferase [Fistulina hepatica ATCC 64428]
MVLKLYASPVSTCSKRVATVLFEKKIPYELVPIDLTKFEQKTPEFLEKQPFGVVPYLDDDGYIIYESRAICRYLEAKYPNQGPTLIPTDLKALGHFEQAASIEYSNFDPFASGVVSERVFKPRKGLGPTDEAKVSALLQTLNTKLDAYDKILSKQKYLAGDEITLADLFHLPYGTMLTATGCDFLTSKSKPNVARWWADITARASWQAVKNAVPASLSA